MLDKEFIKEKINLISLDLERLKIFSGMTIKKASEDYIKYAALKNMLMELIGRAIDINEHLISEIADTKMEIPKTYKETFLLLGRLKIMPQDFAEEISKSAGFRNAIVHEYNNLDKGFVYKTVDEAVMQYSAYCKYIMAYLKHS